MINYRLYKTFFISVETIPSSCTSVELEEMHASHLLVLALTRTSPKFVPGDCVRRELPLPSIRKVLENEPSREAMRAFGVRLARATYEYVGIRYLIPSTTARECFYPFA